MKKRILLISATMVVLVGVLCACGETKQTPADDSSDSASSVESEQTKITLYADFSNGSVDAEELELIKSKEQTISEGVTGEILAKGLSEWTGLDFTINSAELGDDSVTVDWSADSTLIAGLDDRKLKDEFNFLDVESLNWFMMDSLAETFSKNLNINTIYYSMDGGKPIKLEEMSTFTELPLEQPYEGSSFYVAHGDDVDNSMAGQFTYSDKKNNLILSYPDVFSSEGVKTDFDCISFKSQQGESELLYWVIPNTYEEDTTAFMESITAEESEELDSNVVIAKMEDMNQETGEVTPCAYYWIVDTNRIVAVSIQCESSEEAAEWYEAFQGGAVYIESIAGIDGNAGISENEAMNLLSEVISDRMTSGTALVCNGESEMEGQHCWSFSLGKSIDEKFTAEEHYVVTDDGEVYVMDIINNQYEPLAVG